MNSANDEPATFDLKVEPWTVGQLRAALEGVPDDTRIMVFAAEEPGGNAIVPQVMIDTRGPVDPVIEPYAADPDAFTIECEYPPGNYYMPQWPGPRVHEARAKQSPTTGAADQPINSAETNPEDLR